MTDVPPAAADRYDRLSSRFTALVRGVPDDAWDAPTPCEGWTVRDLVVHVAESHHHFLQMVDRAPAPAPAPPEDPVAAAEATFAQTLSDLRDPDRAATTYEGQMGVRTYAWAVDSFLSSDLVVHAWDLARATGQDEAIPAEEIDRITVQVGEWGEMARSPEVYGPALDVPEDADTRTRFLALVGRRAWPAGRAAVSRGHGTPRTGLTSPRGPAPPSPGTPATRSGPAPGP